MRSNNYSTIDQNLISAKNICYSTQENTNVQAIITVNFIIQKTLNVRLNYLNFKLNLEVIKITSTIVY